jgi:hypothetical protein
MVKANVTSARGFSEWLKQYPNGASHATVANWLNGTTPRDNDMYLYFTTTPAGSIQREFATAILTIVNPALVALMTPEI